MTVMKMPGAPLTRINNWKPINWDKVENHVKRLQLRIAKAIKQNRYSKAKALQWILIHSFSAKLLAIKRVTQNKGKNTPDVDKIIWRTEINIRAEATPHDSEYQGYFRQRGSQTETRKEQ